MKKTVLSFAAMAMTLLSCNANAADGKDGNVSFSGQLKGFKDTILVVVPTADGRMKCDTVLVKDGKFQFTVNVDKPCDIYAYTPATARRQENVSLRAIAVPGEKAELSGDLSSSFYFSGSKFYQEYNEADRAADAAKAPLYAFVKSLEDRLKAGEDRNAVMDEYGKKAPELQKQASQGVLDFIAKHPSSEAAAAFVVTLENLEDMKKAAGLLSESVKNGRMRDYYQKTIDRAQQQADAEAVAAKKQAAGVVAPDFTLNDINGKALSLSSLKGKYVVLDFWGSWCGWCIKGFPKMKEYYNKYKGKFEILGIDCNDTQDKWKAAVQKHELPWLHVYNTRDSKVLADYAIQGFPTKIIVGPDGKIVKTVVGEDPSFYTFLDEKFGK